MAYGSLCVSLGTGTFGRVVLVRHRPSKEYFALKILPITEVIRLKQVEHVKSEKAILLMVKHPFIVNL
jgi:protein kinase X